MFTLFDGLPKNSSIMVPLQNTTNFLTLMESQNAFVAAIVLAAGFTALSIVLFVFVCGNTRSANNANNNNGPRA